MIFYLPSDEVVRSFRKTMSIYKNIKLFTNRKVKFFITEKLKEIFKHFAIENQVKIAHHGRMICFESFIVTCIRISMKLENNIKTNKAILDLCDDFCQWIDSSKSAKYYGLERQNSEIILKSPKFS